MFICPCSLRHDNSFWGITFIYWKGSQDCTSFWPKRFYPFTAIIFKSEGTRLYHALFSPISLPANLPRFKPNLTEQPNNSPVTDSYLRFEISWHIWVTFLVIRISYQNFYHYMHLRIHWVNNLHPRECGPLITNDRLVSILIPSFQKRFTLLLRSFSNLEGHADHALFSSISLSANLPRWSPT